MEKIYCISGLGADERVFQNLRVRGAVLECLQWILPQEKEDIRDYAQRMSKQVEDPHPILLGLSFGGFMAIEMAKLLPARKTILISSIQSKSQMPLWMKTAGRLGLNKFLPNRPWGWLAGIENHFLGAHDAPAKKLAEDFRRNIDPAYLRWAIQQVLHWKNEWQPSSFYHLQGTKDKIFPLQRTQATHWIEGGGHFMVMDKASEISTILEDILKLP